jgi:hypothetical protein
MRASEECRVTRGPRVVAKIVTWIRGGSGREAGLTLWDA